jgi:hypothetical protein
VKTFWDSTKIYDIPIGVDGVFYYIDGIYAVSGAEVRARFPDAVLVPIAVFANTNAGLVLDIETGDALPEEAPGWVRMRMAAGIARPVLYVNRSNWDIVRLYCTGLPVDYWLADPTCVEHLVPGTIATQWFWSSRCGGGHFDKSLVAENWLPGGTQTMDPELRNLQIRLMFRALWNQEIPSIAVRDAWIALVNPTASNFERIYLKMSEARSILSAMPLDKVIP